MKNNKPFSKKITTEQINTLPKQAFPGNIYVIDDVKHIDFFADRLLDCKILGFDTETKPTFRKGKLNDVSLLQLATSDDAYLFRTHKTGISNVLKRVFENSSVLKVGVAIKDDIKSLQSLRHFIPGGFIELQDYVKKFDIEDNGLKKLAANILGFRISKRQQTSNWERDMLLEEQVYYAATDAWVCYEMYAKLQQYVVN